MAKGLSVVLVSGGLDSAVAAALAAQESRVALLHFQYGQQAAEPERRAFEALADWINPVQHEVASLGQWRALCKSPVVHPYADVEDAAADSKYLATSFVPMLGPAMICAAAAWAYTVGGDRVIWGITLDNPGNYPDRADAVRLLCWQLVNRSLPEGKAPVIEAPLCQYTKPAVMALATELDVPVDQTWSCLRAGPEPCGRCIGCVSRREALKTVVPGAKA